MNNKKLKLTPKDFDEVSIIAELVIKMDRIDTNYVNAISDEIYKQQPFFLSVLLGYGLDVLIEEFEEIIKIHFLVWEYFRSKSNVQKRKVTETHFTKIQNRNIDMLRYSGGEPKESDKVELYSDDLHKIKSKALWTAVLFRFNERPIFQKMDIETKGAIMIEIKSFIECFETV